MLLRRVTCKHTNSIIYYEDKWHDLREHLYAICFHLKYALIAVMYSKFQYVLMWHVLVALLICQLTIAISICLGFGLLSSQQLLIRLVHIRVPLFGMLEAVPRFARAGPMVDASILQCHVLSLIDGLHLDVP